MLSRDTGVFKMWIDRLSFYMENVYQAYSTQYCFAEVGMMINSWFIKKK